MGLQDFPPTQTILNPVIPGGINGNILFFGAGSTISQSSSLFWDNANLILKLGPGGIFSAKAATGNNYMSAYTVDTTFNATVDHGSIFGYNVTGFGQISDATDTAQMLMLEHNYNDGANRQMEFHLDFAGVGQQFVRPMSVNYRLTGAAANSIFSIVFTTGSTFGTIELDTPTTILKGNNVQDVLRIVNGSSVKESYYRSDGMPCTIGFYIVRDSGDANDQAYLYSGAANECTLEAANVAGAINFRTGGASRWKIDSSGNLTATTDNSFNIGAAGATRPKNINIAGQLIGPSGLVGTPTVSIGATNTGIYSSAASTLDFSIAGARVHSFTSQSYFFISNSAAIYFGTSQDVILTRGGAGILSIQNAANACSVRTYGNATLYTTLSHDGTNGTLDVSSGKLILGGTATDIQWGKALVALGGGAAPTLGTIGGSGPATAAQNSWVQIKDSTGATCWIPAWK